MEHENDPDIDEPCVLPVGNVLGGEADSQSSTEQPTLADTAEGREMLCFLWTVGETVVVKHARHHHLSKFKCGKLNN